eukprot:TRINITY_DN1684_c0_g1_i1.p1 TRINITY_DN1684_c0_g1~~TRINITY_DN1684_c0_g1_i1.p1  ORF type:complete len:468 (-),score=168.76 TRINITY_DN1684_c0_g1_i1:384-1787(-)
MGRGDNSMEQLQNETKDAKQRLNTFLQKFCNRMLVRGDVLYRNEEVDGKFKGFVTLHCLEAQTYDTPADYDDKATAEKEAAKVALEAFQLEVRELVADPNVYKTKKVADYPAGVEPPEKKPRIATPNESGKNSAGLQVGGGTPPKALVQSICNKILKRTVNRDEVVYTLTEESRGNYTASLKLPGLPGELGEEEWTGLPRRSRKDAETSAAEAALEAIRQHEEYGPMLEKMDTRMLRKMGNDESWSSAWEWGWKSAGKGKPRFVLEMYYGPGGKGEGMWPLDEEDQMKALADMTAVYGGKGGGKQPDVKALMDQLGVKEMPMPTPPGKQGKGPQALQEKVLPKPVAAGKVDGMQLPKPVFAGVVQQPGKVKKDAHGLPKIRITQVPIRGEIHEWDGKEGLIQPHAEITHTMASLRNGLVWFTLADIKDSPAEEPDWMMEGQPVSFQCYADTNGLGAEDVDVWLGDME